MKSFLFSETDVSNIWLCKTSVLRIVLNIIYRLTVVSLVLNEYAIINPRRSLKTSYLNTAQQRLDYQSVRFRGRHAWKLHLFLRLRLFLGLSKCPSTLAMTIMQWFVKYKFRSLIFCLLSYPLVDVSVKCQVNFYLPFSLLAFIEYYMIDRNITFYHIEFWK